MNIQEFGASIKKKYPQYADIPDADLGSKMLEKYPQYADMVAQPQQEKPQEKSTGRKILEGAASFTGGKELARGAAAAINSITDKTQESVLMDTETINSIFTQANKLPVGDPKKKELLKQAAQIAGISSQNAQESIDAIPTTKQVLGSAGKLALTVGTLGTSGVAAGLKGTAGVGARVLEGGLTGAAYQALSNLEGAKPVGKGVKTSAMIGGAIPLAGSALSKGRELLGRATKATGEKIVYSTIKPSIADVKDGFDVKTISKYDLNGSLDQMLIKTEDKMKSLVDELQAKIKSTDAPVDLKSVAEDTVKKMLAENKTNNFGNSASIKKVLNALASEIDDVSANGLVSLPEAQAIKQAAGKKGAWVFGSADPDATAIERVYTAFYRELKKKIEDTAPAGVSAINQQISELIPVSNALIRRIPVATRNNALSLGDLLTLGTTALNPQFAPLFVANKLAQSPRFGSLLAELGQRVAEKGGATTNLGKRIFGQ